MAPDARPGWSQQARRFLWLFLVLYGLLTLSLWIGSSAVLGLFGPVTEYTISIAFIIALTFAGLYEATSMIRNGIRPGARNA